MLDKKLLFILNPNAGLRHARRIIPELISVFADHGYLTTLFCTQKQGEATEITEKHCKGMDRIIVAGGDGTLNEVITGLLRGGYQIPIGYLPCGSTNDFASGLHLPTDLMVAARVAMSGAEQTLDIGRFDDRYFCYTAGFGAFTGVSYSTPQNVKNILGHLAYILEGIRSLADIRPIHVQVTTDDRTLEDDYIFGAVCNSTSLGGVMKLDPKVVDVNDGVFETFLVKNPTSPADLSQLIEAIATQHFDTPMVQMIRTSKVSFTTPTGLSWTLDGEYASGGQITVIENLHNAATVMVPHSKRLPDQSSDGQED